MTGLRERAPRPAPDRPRRWCWGTRIVVALTIAWAVFLLAHLLLTGRVWWWSVVEMAPPTAFALPPLVLAVAALRAARGVRWRVEVAALATGVVVAPLLGLNPAALLPSDEPAGADIEVFSWNTDYWWTEGNTPEEFYDYLLDQDADVYLLQEYLTGMDWVEPIDDAERLREHFPGWHLSIASEMVTVSRYPILDSTALDTTGLIGPDDPGAPVEGDWTEYWTTKILRTDLDVDGRTVSMYNTHLSVPVPTFGPSPATAEFWEYMRAQHQRRAAQVDVLDADLAANGNPVLVAGDLNATALSGAVDRLSRRLDCPDPDADVFPASWPTRRFELPRIWRLDWACVGGGASVAHYAFVDGAGISDHDAQRVGIDLEAT